MDAEDGVDAIAERLGWVRRSASGRDGFPGYSTADYWSVSARDIAEMRAYPMEALPLLIVAGTGLLGDDIGSADVHEDFHRSVVAPYLSMRLEMGI